MTSIGVLNVAMEETNDSTRPRCSITSGSANDSAEGGPAGFVVAVGALRYRIGGDLLVQFSQLRRTGQRDLTLHLGQQIGPPCPQVTDARSEALRMEGEPHGVQRWGEQMLRDPFQQHRDASIGRHHGVGAVDDESRIRVVPLQQLLHAVAQRAHRRVVERGLRVAGRVTGHHQQGVAFPDRDVEMIGQPQDHLLAGARTARLDERDVTGRGVGAQGQLQLADPPLLTPTAQQWPYPRV